MKNILLLLVFLPASLFSQEIEHKKDYHQLSIGIVPQYAISNGIRFDIDLQLSKSNQSLVIAPQIYISTRDGALWNYNSMIGSGLEIQHRIYLKSNNSAEGAYFGYGPVFNFFAVKDDGLTVRRFVNNGGNYLGLIEEEMTTRIYKFGGNFIIGIKGITPGNLYLDPFIGMGIRFSFDDKLSGFHNYYNDWWGDMGYSGILMVGGLRLGIVF